MDTEKANPEPHRRRMSDANSMTAIKISTLALSLVFISQIAADELLFDDPIDCAYCDRWNEPQAPFKIYANTYYVGTKGLSSILVVTDGGLILIDAALPQSAKLIADNIRELGFDTTDVRLILNSHAHFDHAGGIASLQRLSDAIVAMSEASAEALRFGGVMADDPQFGFGYESNRFPAVDEIQIVKDGESLHIGEFEITPYLTPGHTPGSTTWTWQSCADDECMHLVYVDSMSPVSAPGFQFTANNGDLIHDFEQSIRTLKTLDCDILLAPHPDAFGLADKYRELVDENPRAFVNSQACDDYATAVRERLDQRIEDENMVLLPEK